MIDFLFGLLLFIVFVAMVLGLMYLVQHTIENIKIERACAKREAIENYEICAKCERELKPYEVIHKCSIGYVKTYALCDDCYKELYGEGDKNVE